MVTRRVGCIVGCAVLPALFEVAEPDAVGAPTLKPLLVAKAKPVLVPPVTLDVKMLLYRTTLEFNVVETLEVICGICAAVSVQLWLPAAAPSTVGCAAKNGVVIRPAGVLPISSRPAMTRPRPSGNVIVLLAA